MTHIELICFKQMIIDKKRVIKITNALYMNKLRAIIGKSLEGALLLSVISESILKIII